MAAAAGPRVQHHAVSGRWQQLLDREYNITLSVVGGSRRSLARAGRWLAVEQRAGVCAVCGGPGHCVWWAWPLQRLLLAHLLCRPDVRCKQAMAACAGKRLVHAAWRCAVAVWQHAASSGLAAVLQAKHKGEHSGRGGDWAVRIESSRLAGAQRAGDPRPPRRRLSLVFYMAEENAGQQVEVRGAEAARRRCTWRCVWSTGAGAVLEHWCWCCTGAESAARKPVGGGAVAAESCHAYQIAMPACQHLAPETAALLITTTPSAALLSTHTLWRHRQGSDRHWCRGQ